MELVVATGNPHKVEEIAAILAPHGVSVIGLDALGWTGPEPEENGTTFEANAAIKARAYAKALGRVVLADDSGLEVDALGGAPGVHSARYAGIGTTRAERDAANNAKLLQELDRAIRAGGSGEPLTSQHTHTPMSTLVELSVTSSAERQATGALDACTAGSSAIGPRGVDAVGCAVGAGSTIDPRRSARFVCTICVAAPDGTGLATARGTFDGVILHAGRGANGFGYDPLLWVPDAGCSSAELSSDEKNRRSHRGHAVRALVSSLQAIAQAR